jgi:hypothetical protein
MDIQIIGQSPIKATVDLVHGMSHPERQDVPGQFLVQLFSEIGFVECWKFRWHKSSRGLDEMVSRENSA